MAIQGQVKNQQIPADALQRYLDHYELDAQDLEDIPSLLKLITDKYNTDVYIKAERTTPYVESLKANIRTLEAALAAQARQIEVQQARQIEAQSQQTAVIRNLQQALLAYAERTKIERTLR